MSANLRDENHSVELELIARTTTNDVNLQSDLFRFPGVPFFSAPTMVVGGGEGEGEDGIKLILNVLSK